MALDLRTSELEYQFIQDRINSVEDHFSELCVEFSKYAKQVGKLRDCGDELAKTVLKVSSKEILNHSLRSALARFSDVLSAVQDYREAEVQRLDHKVILQLSSYGQICKHAREDLKKNFAARSKEIIKKQQLEKMRGKKPTNWQQINQAEREAEKAKNDATEATINLAQKIDGFEKKKLEDMKRIFLDYANIQLLFHCKAVELYTNAYTTIKGIKVEDDLQVFRNRFRSPFTIGDVNLSPLPGERAVIPDAINKTEETAPLKQINSADETTTVSSCSGLSSGTVSDNFSESKNSDVQTFKSFKWNY